MECERTGNSAGPQRSPGEGRAEASGQFAGMPDKADTSGTLSAAISGRHWSRLPPPNGRPETATLPNLRILF